ncbi:MAG: PAS domain-containing protein [Ginsengibacter sp.]
MDLAQKNRPRPKQTGTYRANAALHRLAFDYSLHPNIITTVGSGRIIIVNNAAGKLLGYPKKELLTKTRSDIFDINDSVFKQMLRKKAVDGHSVALITTIKKSGGATLPGEITSAVFTDENGIEMVIINIRDLRQEILDQQNKVSIQEKIAAANSAIAASKQKKTDIQNEKIVTHNIAAALAKSNARLADNNEWIKYIAKTSYDVMWDWDIATGRVYVGESIREVFGYNLPNDISNFKNFLDCLLPNEKEKVQKKLMKALAGRNKSWKDAYMFRRQDGSIASTISRASIVRNDKGKATRMIGAIQDVSRLQELEKKLKVQVIIPDEKGRSLKQTARHSFDGMWDWNILTNEFFLGEGFEELFGYAFENVGNIAFNWSDFLHPDDKDAVEKGLQDAVESDVAQWQHAFRFMRTNGSVAKVFGRGSIIRDASGKAFRMMGAIHDLSRQIDLEEKLAEEIATRGELITDYKKNFKLLFNSSSNVLFDIDLLNNEAMISDAYEKEFGYTLKNNMASRGDWFTHFHPDDNERVIQDFLRALSSEDMEWKYSFRFLRANNSVANVSGSSMILRDAGGKAYRLIGSMQDNSKQKVLEEKLAQEIKLKEKQVAAATGEARKIERHELGRELHDNVNQLLGASRLYLNMAKHGGEDSEMYLSRSSEYTLTAIEAIRKLTMGLTSHNIRNPGLCQSIDNLAKDIMEVTTVKISCALERFIEHHVNDEFKLNVFRIVQEQLNNILKHAKATEVAIRLLQNKESIVLFIADNGVGFDAAIKQKGIGINNIKSRAASYTGIADFISQPGAGCALTVTFPITDALERKIKKVKPYAHAD